MEIRQTLVDISNDARGWLNVWIKDFSDDEATRRVDHDGPNPLAWQLGHLAGVEDDVYQLFSGKPSIVPPALKAACRTGSPAPTSATTFPPLPELRALLDRTHAALLGLLENATPSDLDRPALVENKFFRTLGQSVYEAALHENYHVGEISALRKALGKPRIG